VSRKPDIQTQSREDFVRACVKELADSGQAQDPMEFPVLRDDAGAAWDRLQRQRAAVKDLFAAYGNGDPLPIDEFLKAMGKL
jgi:hypothetical protein